MPAKSMEQNLERLAERLLPIKVAGAAVGLEDHRRMLAAHAQRVLDSHRAMAKAAGFELPAEQGADNLGDIIITGDIIQPTPPPPSSPPPSSPPSRLLHVALLAAGLAAGGIGGPLIASLLMGSRPAAVQPAGPPPAAQEWEIKIWSVDGKPQQSIKPVTPSN